MNSPSPRRRRLGGRLRALLVGCALAFFLLEIALRLLTLLPWNTGQFVADQATGFRQRPGALIGGLPTNSRGFNDQEPPARKAGRRIGLVGDSFVFGVVPRGLDLVSRLELLTKGRKSKVEVLNLGILAAGPENYLGVLEKDARELELDTALVVFFVGNDVSQADPDFKTRIFLGSPRAVLSSPWLIRPSADYLYSLKMLRGGWRLFHEEVLHRPEPGGTFSRQIFLEIEKQRLEICRKAPSPAIERGFAGVAMFFDELQRIGREQGLDIAVAIAPDQYQVDLSFQAELLARVHAKDFDMSLPQKRIMALLEERGIAAVDLLPELRRVAFAREVYLERDTHWNVAGNRVVAQYVLKAMDSWGWLDSKAQPD